MKVIKLGFIGLILSCGGLTVEKRSVSGCDVVDRPYGREGTLSVRCRDGFSMKVFYDNIPDGRDPIVLRVEGIEGNLIKRRTIEPYSVEVGNEILSGWAIEEEWKVGEYVLRGFEYFVNGGTSCYEEEEGYSIYLETGEKSITLAHFYQEYTDCGGA